MGGPGRWRWLLLASGAVLLGWLIPRNDPIAVMAAPLARHSVDADVLITDCTYTDEEYRRRAGWGHSCVSQVADLAWRARVRALYLVHHDPDQNDAAIDGKLDRARELLRARGAATEVYAPTEYAEVEVSGSGAAPTASETPSASS
jgi:hypothetical protein